MFPTSATADLKNFEDLLKVKFSLDRKATAIFMLNPRSTWLCGFFR